MIVYPEDWNKVGQEIQIVQIEETLLNILRDINCNCLSYSGGIDSTIMLYLMLKIYKEVNVFTIGISEDHPDINISKLVTKQFLNVNHRIFIPTKSEIEGATWDGDFEGDNAVRCFYEKLEQSDVGKIIACDGIDEFVCGYYAHINSPVEKTYYTFIRRLQSEQLVPLNKNSGEVKVYLPYIDSKLIYLYSQIPLKDKTRNKCRKSIMVQLAERLNVPGEVINRRKYGFCDALKEKK